jgi:hypothetical protein
MIVFLLTISDYDTIIINIRMTANRRCGMDACAGTDLWSWLRNEAPASGFSPLSDAGAGIRFLEVCGLLASPWAVFRSRGRGPGFGIRFGRTAKPGAVRQTRVGAVKSRPGYFSAEQHADNAEDADRVSRIWLI